MSAGQYAAGTALTDRLKRHGGQGSRRALLLIVIIVSALLSAHLWGLRVCDNAGEAAGYSQQQQGQHEAPLLNLIGVKHHNRLRLSRLKLDKGDLWMVGSGRFSAAAALCYHCL